MPEYLPIVLVAMRRITTRLQTLHMQPPSSQLHVLPAIHKPDGHLLHIITMLSSSRLTVESTKASGPYVVNVIQMHPIMLFLIACFVTHTAIKLRLIQITKGKVDMSITALIVYRVIQGEPLINLVWKGAQIFKDCLLYTSPSPRDGLLSRMPSSA